MLTKEAKELFDKTNIETNGCVGADQYGDKNNILYIQEVDSNYERIKLSNGREYTLSFRYNPNEELSKYTEIDWFPEQQLGDWDLVKLANYDGWEFIHGS